MCCKRLIFMSSWLYSRDWVCLFYRLGLHLDGFPVKVGSSSRTPAYHLHPSTQKRVITWFIDAWYLVVWEMALTTDGHLEREVGEHTYVVRHWGVPSVPDRLYYIDRNQLVRLIMDGVLFRWPPSWNLPQFCSYPLVSTLRFWCIWVWNGKMQATLPHKQVHCWHINITVPRYKWSEKLYIAFEKGVGLPV